MGVTVWVFERRAPETETSPSKCATAAWKAVLWIRDILVQVRRSVHLTMTTDPDPDPAIFILDLQDANKKLLITF